MIVWEKEKKKRGEALCKAVHQLSNCVDKFRLYSAISKQNLVYVCFEMKA